jgi:hypothetical protein
MVLWKDDSTRLPKEEITAHVTFTPLLGPLNGIGVSGRF